MKYVLCVNQQKALELGIKNISQAHIFDLLTTASTWANPEIVEKEVYYWVARQAICSELVLLNMKPDTVYRHLKAISQLGLIEYIKVGKKDCIKITNIGKKYLSKDYVGNKSEKDNSSEMNPTKLGNKSENNSEMNPTYPTTTSNPTTNNKESLFNHHLYKELSPKEKELYLEYAAIRKSLKIQTTLAIHERLLKKYFEFGRDVSVIENAINANWKDFYQPKRSFNTGKEPEVGSIAWRMKQEQEVIDVSA